MQVRHGFKALAATALTGAMLLVGVVTTTSTAGAATASVPGLTPTSVTVGTISTQTGTLASNFSSLIYGERAYFNYINAQGGVNGRKINYQYALDDGGNPTTFNQLANTLINQDHVFAVTGVATAFFSPNLFTESGIPTYGYNVTGNWAGPTNLFAAGGSVQYYPAAAPQVSYVARSHAEEALHRLHRLRGGRLRGLVPVGAELAEGGGVHRELLRPQGQLPRFDGGHRRAAHEAGRLQHGRQLHGRAGQRHHGPGHQAVRPDNMTQLWFSGNDQSTLNTNQSLMQGVYFDIAHVPFTASPTLYPGLKLYFAQMKKYEPEYTTDEIALQGWESAALFVQGLKMAGKNPTQASVIAADNSLTAFTSGGLQAPVNWKSAGHNGQCAAVLPRLHQGVGEQVPADTEQGQERLQLLPVDQPEEEPRLPVAGRHTVPVLSHGTDRDRAGIGVR